MGEITRRGFNAGLTGIFAGLGKDAAAPERTNVVYIMPPIAEFTGTQRHLPAGIGGITLVPEVTGKARLNRERPMYWEWNEGHFAAPYRVKMQACRRGQWKIVRNDVPRPWELYDLEQDPGEKRDRAAGHAAVVAELEAWVRANRVDPPEQVEPAKPAGQQWR